MDLEDKRILSKTLEIRERIVDSLLKQGEGPFTVPSDKSDRELLVNMLAGMDKVAVSRSKIAAEENTAKTNGEISLMVAGILKKVNLSPGQMHNNPIPVLPEELSQITLVPGETHIGDMNLDLDDIIR
jgi:hypothetical protein